MCELFKDFIESDERYDFENKGDEHGEKSNSIINLNNNILFY